MYDCTRYLSRDHRERYRELQAVEAARKAGRPVPPTPFLDSSESGLSKVIGEIKARLLASQNQAASQSAIPAGTAASANALVIDAVPRAQVGGHMAATPVQTSSTESTENPLPKDCRRKQNEAAIKEAAEAQSDVNLGEISSSADQDLQPTVQSTTPASVAPNALWLDTERRRLLAGLPPTATNQPALVGEEVNPLLRDADARAAAAKRTLTSSAVPKDASIGNALLADANKRAEIAEQKGANQ